MSWLQPLALLLVAAILGYTAYSTRRIVRHGPSCCCRTRRSTGWCWPVPAHSSGRWCSGGYLGYALSWVGDEAELADERIWRSVAASFAGLLIVITALLLERACRVRDLDPEAMRVAGSGPTRLT